MLRALWFLLKAAVLLGAIVWVTRQPARPVDITTPWFDGGTYAVEIDAAFLLFLLALLLFAATRIDRIWRAFVSMPAVYRRYRRAARREKGYRTVTDGLVAVAAGDAQAATKLSRRAEDMIPGTPLTKLLSAQAALLSGNAPKARRQFAELLDDRSAAFFGVRGLLNETLAEGNYREALALARRAEELQPKRIWIIRTLFDLETRNREWLKAERTLRKAEKIRVFDRAAAAAHRQAIWTAMSQDAEARGEPAAALRLAESAFRLDPGFTPAALRVAGLLEAKGKRRAAVKAVEAAWTRNPHPALAALWMSWAPAPKKSKSIYDAGREGYEWAKRLFDLAPEHRDAHRLLGHAALDARLWREARTHLATGGDYRLLARLEREESGNEAKAREWLEQAAENPPDPRWVCRACGHAAPDWQALCRHCGHFNSVSWLTPSLDPHAPAPKAIAPGTDLLSPPRYAEV